MSTSTIDYDALASQHGGTAQVDYDALAAQHGGSAGNAQLATVGTMSAIPQPQSFADKATQWAQNVASDLKNGTDLTGVGHVLKAMGAHGLNYGNSEGVADFMGSLPLGLAKMVQGGGEVGQGKVGQGAKDMAGGALQAATIPASFAAPEVGEAAANGVAKTGAAIAGKVSPSAMKEAAGGLLQSVAHDANKIPVQLDNSGDAAWRLMQWQGKTQLGPTVNKYLNRITNPKLGPLTYEEARDYYQLLGKLSADEASKLAPPVRRDLVQMVVGLKQDIGNAADQVGRAADYYQGLKDYARAASYQKWYDAAKNLLTNETAAGIAKGLGLGAGGALAYQLYKQGSK